MARYYEEDLSSRPARAKMFGGLISTNKKMDVVPCICHPGYTGSINRIGGPGWPRHKDENLFKN
jgi:hypothetical protein